MSHNKRMLFSRSATWTSFQSAQNAGVMRLFNVIQGINYGSW